MAPTSYELRIPEPGSALWPSISHASYLTLEDPVPLSDRSRQVNREVNAALCAGKHVTSTPCFPCFKAAPEHGLSTADGV